MLVTVPLMYNRYLIRKVLKQETHEEVFLVEDQQQNNEVYTITKFSSKTLGDLEAELNILANLKHSQIQEVKYFFEENERLCIVQNNIEGQSYEDLLQEKKQQNEPLFNEYEIVQLLNLILPILSYLDNHQVTHRNISPKNLILREQDKIPVLVNFGLIQDIRDWVLEETNQNESHNFPKLATRNQSKDLQDLAVTALILLTGKEHQDLFNEKTKTWDWERWKILSDQRSHVLKQMLQGNHLDINPNSVLQELNTTLPVFITPQPVPKLFGNLIGGVGALLLLTGIVWLLSSNSSPDSVNPPVTFVDEQELQCPSSSDIVAISCNANTFTEVNDIDSGDFDGGKLTVNLTQNGTLDDRLRIENQSLNAELIKVKDRDVMYRDTIVGSFTGGTGTIPLEITFNSNANTEVVKTIVNSIVYQNLTKNFSQSTRTLELQLTDGDGGTSRVLKKVISIHPINSSPILTVLSQQAVKEEQQLSVRGISVKDNDAGDSIVGVALSVENGTLIIKDDVKNGVPTGQTQTGEKPNAVILFGTINQINNTLKADKAIVYKSNADFNGIDNLTITVNDSGKNRNSTVGDLIWPPNALDAKSDTKTIQITVEPVNDAPILGNLQVTEQPSPNNNTQSQFSREDAVNLIKTWLEAKKEAYGSSYNAQVIYQYTTGNYQRKNLSTLRTLQEENAYYTFEQPIVEPIGQFYAQDNQVTIDVRIRENRTHYVGGQFEPTYSGSVSGLYKATLQLENGVWKIAVLQEN
ncbi:hypothetical protein NUACC21_68710 [Scytonema sp. NUACC21]